MNWCRDFVVPYNLCPWAAQSVQTSAVQIVAVPGNRFQAIIEAEATAFYHKLQQKTIDPNTAIVFVVVANGAFDDFVAFYNWFVEAEDAWFDRADENDPVAEAITLAPFHPDWEFADSEGETVAMEKRAPYPTVSLVSADVIQRAGPSATIRIAEENAKTLQGKSSDEWQAIYTRAVFRQAE